MDSLPSFIHDVYQKYAQENAQVEALCLAYLLQIGEESIEDYTLVRQSSPDTLTTRIWLQRKEDPIPAFDPPPAPRRGLVEQYAKE
jgi:hypothetical protein